MTPEQLKNLAEIAGVEVHADAERTLWEVSRKGAKKWQPHIKIEQAMMVAEGMQKNGFNISISNHVEWRAVFYYRDIPGYFESIADTPAEAICASALATIGG